jgi:hypothetical protein
MQTTLMNHSNKTRPITPPNVPLDSSEIEARLHSILGRFFVVFARVELNLSLRVGGDGSFVDKLERLLSSSGELDDEDTFWKTSAWNMAAHSMRDTRNLLAHGRWGFLVHSQQVAHVSGYPPGPQKKRRFSLPELDAIVRDADLLHLELSRLIK